MTVGAVVLNSHGRVCLLLRHRFRPQSGWGIQAALLAQEQPEAALRRELRGRNRHS